MTVSQRQEKILALLQEHPDIRVAELAKCLYVSEPTVRRDLTELDAAGLIHKVYGGAVLPDHADRSIPFVLRENEKSRAKAVMGRQAAELVSDGMVLLLDASKGEPQALLRQAHELQQQLHLSDSRPVCIVLNKIDLLPAAVREQLEREMTTADLPTLFLSAKRRIGVDRLKSFLSGCVDRERLDDGAAIVSNFRHYEALLHARESLARGLEGLKAGLSSDLLAEEVRAALYQIGLVVGEVTTDEILGQIFSKFCVGK